MPFGVGNPWMLLALAGVAVPVIIHLLNRFRQRRIEWAAMELLRRAMMIRSRRVRLEDLLLLLLRCLAVALVALGMARLAIRSEAARWFGAPESVGAVVAIDASYSMAQRPGVGSRFDRALDIVRDLKAALNPGDPVSVVLLGARPRTLLRNTAFDDRRLEAALRDAAPLAEPVTLEPCLERVRLLAQEMKTAVRECYLVTDGQAATWAGLSPKARQHLADIGGDARLFLLPTPPDGGENLAVTDLALVSGALRRGTVARFAARVANFGRRPAGRLVVSLTAGDAVVDQAVLDQVEPGQVATVPLFAALQDAGSLHLAARIGQDALPVDNVRFAVARVRDRVAVLVVDGDPSDRPFGGEADFVVTALVPKPPAQGTPSLAVERVPWLDLGSRRLDAYQVVVLANVPDLAPPQVEDLFHFVQGGGGLVVFLGDRVNPLLASARLRRGGTALLPADLADAADLASDDPSGVPLAVADAGHPLAQALGCLPEGLVGETRIRRAARATPAPDGRTVLAVAGSGAPLLLEKTLGRGKVLLWTTAADRAWSNLPVHPAYPILLHEAVAYLVRQSYERPVRVGEAITVPLARRGAETSATFTGPGGEAVVVTVTERDGARLAEFDRTDEPGFYEMAAAGGAAPVVVAVNVDSRESDTKTLSPEGLGRALAGLPVRVLGPGENPASVIRESRTGRPLWPHLLGLALAVLALEGYLGWRFSRQASDASGAAAVDLGRAERPARRAAG